MKIPGRPGGFLGLSQQFPIEKLGKFGESLENVDSHGRTWGNLGIFWGTPKESSELTNFSISSIPGGKLRKAVQKEDGN